MNRAVATLAVLVATPVHAHADDAPKVETKDNVVSGKLFERFEYIVVDGQQQKHGDYKRYFDGQVTMLEGRYEYGKRIGLWTTYHDAKKHAKSFETYYDNDVIHGTRTQFATSCDDNTRVVARTEFVRGNRHGLYVEWNCRGKKTREGQFEYDTEQGRWVSYGLMGDYVVQTGDYECGMKSGEWNRQDAKGKVTGKDTYKVDAAKKEKCVLLRKQVDVITKIWDLVLGPGMRSCTHPGKDVVSKTPCNIFVGVVLEKLFGIHDFADGSGYLSAANIGDALWRGKIKGWEIVTPEEAQRRANAGKPVLATRGRHVALVISGEGTNTGWTKGFAPTVVSLFLDSRTEGKDPFRCMPCTVNYAFGEELDKKKKPVVPVFFAPRVSDASSP